MYLYNVPLVRKTSTFNPVFSSVRHSFFDDVNEATDATESAALVHKLEIIGIYSNSWGPEDSAWIIEGPGPLTSAALEKGIKEVSYRVIRAFTIE